MAGEDAGKSPGDRVWIIVRRGPDGRVEPLAACPDERQALGIVAELGAGHEVEPGIPLLSPGSGYAVAAWWRCRAAVRGGVVEVSEPSRMSGAARLLLPGDRLSREESVWVDDKAGALEEAVHGIRVHYVEAIALSGARARELVEARAAEIVGTGG